MATRKTYNSVDTKNNLLLVERTDGGFGGYNADLLVDSLSALELQLLVCTKCNGVMNQACQVGEDQLHMCESCMDEGDEFQPMKLSRNSIPGLKSKCPLDTRGCMWSGPLAETEAHLDECQEFVINCPNECEIIIKRSELENHLTECKLLKVECEHCGLRILNSDLEVHHEECLDIQITCPNECSVTLKRCESEDHVATDCPNTLINCPFKAFGCKELVKRGELDQHQQDSESKHTQLQLNFALSKIESMEENRKKAEKQYAEDVAELKERLDTQEETIIGLEQEKSQLSSKLQTNRKGSSNSLTGSVELIHDNMRYSSPSLSTPSPSLEDLASSIVIKNIGSTVEYKNIITTTEKVVIHFFDNSSVSQIINFQYKQTSAMYPNIKFCQANVSNDRGISKVAGVKFTHEIHFYNQGVKMSILRWKDQESYGSALYNLDTI
ncbi:TNF receptor-associated factor 4-like isoform X1 [Oopsacas minuta]|uniref:TNF receptor-associated factor 4-like isoform X1 n=1 Tax=Oopsacas minuta TaxID=111878 RepID=A0AAV7JEX9_9METZ|nr:TNF receptor-associated factor 4-like isoform X1 [Oopsacas minuta]